MKHKKYIILLLIVLIIIGINTKVAINLSSNKNTGIEITYKTLSDRLDTYQLYYSVGNYFGESQSIKEDYVQVNQEQVMKFIIPKETKFIRIDLGNSSGNIWIKDFKIKYDYKNVFLNNLEVASGEKSNWIGEISNNDEWLTINSTGNDPYIIINMSNYINIEKINIISSVIKIILLVLMDFLFMLAFKKREKIKGIINEIYVNRLLIWNLSLNDFKTKYAGSYLGIFWAFVQPIVTTLIYWFVFDFGFKAAPASSDIPFILWLIAGIVPWFFFSEAVMNATNSLLEYSYLVKKVVFKISILPIVKILSSFFIHIFFVSIVFVIFLLYKHIPSIHIIQIIYYMFCTAILALSISYATSAIIVFFKDLGQIINVVLQIGMWLTPIMWNKSMLNEKYHWILKLNPIYYIVEGYRDCFINRVWFWDKYMQTTYFWFITIGLFFISLIIFRRLKNHFADVL